MTWKIFSGLFLVFMCLIGGCSVQTGNSLPSISHPPAISPESYVNSGGTALAIAFRAEEISTTSPEAKELFLTGLSYSTQCGRYNESLPFFDKALSLDRNFSEAWTAKAVALHNLKRFDEAIACYDRALEIGPNDSQTWQLKGITLRDYGKAGESAECFRKSAELDPRDTTQQHDP
jgi:tetratricopeptide (TPR) repeat protein